MVVIAALAIHFSSVAIPLGTYGLADLVERLAEPGHPIYLVSRLEGRAALVGLSARSREENLRFVCEAMDLHITKAASGQLTLEPAPDTEARERKFRRGFLDSIAASFRQALTAKTDNGAEDSPAVIADAEKRLGRLQNVSDTELSKDERAEKSKLQMVVARAALSRGDLAAGAYLVNQNLHSIDDSIFENGAFYSPISKANISLEQSAILSQIFPNATSTSDSYIDVGLSRGDTSIRIDTGLLVHNSDGQYQGYNANLGGAISFLDDKIPMFPDLEKLFTTKILGTEAPVWLKTERAKTAAYLAGTDAQFEFDIDRNRADALSGLIQSWAHGTMRDVVMELAPQSEGCKGTFASTLGAQPAVKSNLSTLFDPTVAWTFHSDGSVLLVKDQLAFLDRPERRRDDRLANLEREAGDASVSVLNLESPEAKNAVLYSTLRKYYAADWSGSGRLKTITTGPALTYRGFWISKISRSHPVSFLWDSLTPARKREILMSSPKGSLMLPVSSFGEHVPAYTELVRRQYDSNMPGYDRLPLQGLADECVRIRWERLEGDTYTVSVSLRSDQSDVWPGRYSAEMPVFRFSLPNSIGGSIRREGEFISLRR